MGYAIAAIICTVLIIIVVFGIRISLTEMPGQDDIEP